ncbi:Uncharacterised protein [Mycobacteroides abscessus subsp. abscessus]|nr:Uncharacterised protein [Mycobacteroides abscessus subsp. abscessus]
MMELAKCVWNLIRVTAYPSRSCRTPAQQGDSQRNGIGTRWWPSPPAAISTQRTRGALLSTHYATSMKNMPWF